jgi:hypothetical protein
MLELIITSKAFECPCCGAEGMVARLNGSGLSRLSDQRFRAEIRNGEPEIVCAECDAPVDTVMRSGYN